jgi:MoxR-like ATPase
MSAWPIYKGTNVANDSVLSLPAAPPWRQFGEKTLRGATFQASPEEILAVNAALYLRRPLLVTGKPGTGKTSLAYAVAHELKLGTVLTWSITSRSTVSEGLYRYDAIGRMQDAQLNPHQSPEIGKYLRLGPLGTALLPSPRPQVLLVDELDKSDIDLPNDLLNVFDEGEYEIPELARLAQLNVPVRRHESHEISVINEGRVRCTAFPFVVITSNGEREFSPPFLRRCLRLDLLQPSKEKLGHIVRAHLGPEIEKASGPLIDDFLVRRDRGDIATDQLLSTIFLITQESVLKSEDQILKLKNTLLRTLGSSQTL